MGAELPPELTELASKTGAHWPEADEDAMRRLANAWRQAARSLQSLAGEADATVLSALGAFQGEAAEAAGRQWAELINDDGVLPSSIRGCLAAADRLDHAAERIGESKQELIRELTTLARHREAAEHAAESGHPQALAEFNAAVRDTSVTVARVHHSLTSELGSGGGVVMEQGSRFAGMPERAVPSTTASIVDNNGQDAGKMPGTAAHGSPGMPGNTAGVAGAQHAMGDAEPDSVAAFGGPPGEVGRTNADSNTGPIPMIRESGGPNPSHAVDPTSTTAPHAVQSAWAHAPAQPPAMGAPQQPQPPQPVVHSGGVLGPYAGPGAAAPHQGPRPSVGNGYIRAASSGPNSRAVEPRPMAPMRPNQPVRRVPLMPPRGSQQPAVPSETPQRGLRHGPRNAEAVAFVLHQFPIGHMPLAAHGASRQLPTPAAEGSRTGLNFPPQDHPDSHLVTDAEALELARSGEIYQVAQQRRREQDESKALPERLLTRHDQLGELSEVEWERRYVTGQGERLGYRWPPAEEFPEGGHEQGEPVVLAPGTVIDLLGEGNGRVLYATKTPFAHRSLPADHAQRPYRSYRVVHPVPAWRSVAAPWFEQPGGGVRYRTTYPAVDLVGLGYLVELTRARRIAEAPTLRIRVSGPAGQVADDEQEAEQ